MRILLKQKYNEISSEIIKTINLFEHLECGTSLNQ